MSSPSHSTANIGRLHFDADTLAAMDEIAALVLAYQSLSGMVATFKNATKLDHGEAKPHAEKVLLAIKLTAAALQNAIFTVKKSKRTDKLAAARQQHLQLILEAAPSAQWLAEKVSATVGGNEIDVRVLATLRNISSAWTQSSQCAAK
ncbi:hypothetical protein P245_20915 [Comamonas thiooxydans]|uniref:Uncharacterized protein n=1 Tax=Comamonas thiooxydans TaxID=363952 RepID=A0A0E3B9S1_9BURK|nr:hypothetical protein [Comamonas thiooxydans]KGG86182.1 hypothetical protein P245_20915 [Comamonas thiooxydans]